MHAVLRYRALLIALLLLAYLGLQALALGHEYDGEQHPAGEICGLCLSIAQADKPLPATALPPLAAGSAPRPRPTLSLRTAAAPTRFHPARAPPAHA